MKEKSHFLNASFWILIFMIFGHVQTIRAQESGEKAQSPGLGHGLNFSLNENQYQFQISGFLQPSWTYSKFDTLKSENTLRSKRSYLSFSGKALKEKVSFNVTADFSAPSPLLDAWVAYHFLTNWSVSAGQRRTFTNNREMTFNENVLQFSERGLLSSTFSGNGREFGLFVEGKIGKKVVLVPQLAITSGDGPNSFGINSTDVDLGGFKYGGRLDIYPLGEFSEGNQGFSADLKHEAKPKILLGVAGSLNQGASSPKGEGHGDFLMYSKNKQSSLPDYRKFSADILLKYKGFSVMAEWMNASASGLNGLYLDTTSLPKSALKPGQISQFLVLGNAISAQLGYVTKSGFALDLRYSTLNPEFTKETLSLLQENTISTIGLSKYFPDNHLKVQAQASQIEHKGGKKTMQSEVMVQVSF